MTDLTPRQIKMLSVINSGPWPFGVSELMDDDFSVLRERKLIVLRDDPVRGDRVHITAAGEALAEHLAAEAHKAAVHS